MCNFAWSMSHIFFEKNFEKYHSIVEFVFGKLGGFLPVFYETFVTEYPQGLLKHFHQPMCYWVKCELFPENFSKASIKIFENGPFFWVIKLIISY